MPPTYHEDEPKNAFDSALAAGAALLGEVHQVPADIGPGGAYTIIPDGYQIESLEAYMARPQRIRQNVVLHDVASFIAYAQDFAVLDTSRLFFNVDNESFKLVIDYHDANNVPAWCEHTAVFAPRRSEEFKTWTA